MVEIQPGPFVSRLDTNTGSFSARGDSEATFYRVLWSDGAGVFRNSNTEFKLGDCGVGISVQFGGVSESSSTFLHQEVRLTCDER